MPIAGTHGTPTYQPIIWGAWSYRSATLTSGTLTATGRCIGLRVFAQTTDGTFNVNGGDIITVRAGAGVDVNPHGNLDGTITVTWLSGTLDVVIEVVN